MTTSLNGTPQERKKLTELIASVKALEAAADRVEKLGGMRRYPEQARAMAEDNKVEARELWSRGVRPLPVPTSAEKIAPPAATIRAEDLYSTCPACRGSNEMRVRPQPPQPCRDCDGGIVLTESGKALLGFLQKVKRGRLVK